MFTKITQVDSKLKKYIIKNPSYYPIRSAKALLAKPKCADLIKKLSSRNIVNAPEEYFEALYASVIHDFAGFVQGLPAIKYVSHNYHGGMLELGLERALEALQSYRTEYSVKQFMPEKMPPKLALWTYALFTAALFYGIGQIEATYWVAACDEKGHHPKRWHPLVEPIKTLGSHYRYTYEQLSHDDLAAWTTPLIARQLMPKEGFDWIARDQEILTFWLAVLQNDEKAGGLLAKYILLADEHLINEFDAIYGASRKRYHVEQEQDKDQHHEDDDQDEQSKQDRDKEQTQEHDKKLEKKYREKTAADVSGSQTIEIGEHFLNWLKKAVKGHAVSVYRVDDGRLHVNADAFQAFIQENPQYKTWQTVFQAVDRQYAGGIAQRFQQHSTRNLHVLGQKQKPGISFDPSVLFHTNQIPAMVKALPEDIKISTTIVEKVYPKIQTVQNTVQASSKTSQ